MIFLVVTLRFISTICFTFCTSPALGIEHERLLHSCFQSSLSCHKNTPATFLQYFAEYLENSLGVLRTVVFGQVKGLLVPSLCTFFSFLVLCVKLSNLSVNARVLSDLLCCYFVVHFNNSFHFLHIAWRCALNRSVLCILVFSRVSASTKIPQSLFYSILPSMLAINHLQLKS